MIGANAPYSIASNFSFSLVKYLSYNEKKNISRKIVGNFVHFPICKQILVVNEETLLQIRIIGGKGAIRPAYFYFLVYKPTHPDNLLLRIT